MHFAKYVKLRNEKFGAVVFDTLKEKVYVTNESGSEILSLIADGVSASVIAERLAQEYKKGASQIQNDVAEFIDGLRSAGLVASSTEDKP